MTIIDFKNMPISKADARVLTEQIQVSASEVATLIATAYDLRVWEPLGYPTWNAYCAGEFADLSFSRESRAVTVASLRQAGLSQRAIASAIGVGQSTVCKTLKQVIENRSPDQAIGTDGKSYPAKRRKPVEPPLTPPTSINNKKTGPQRLKARAEARHSLVNAAISLNALSRQVEKIIAADLEFTPKDEELQKAPDVIYAAVKSIAHSLKGILNVRATYRP